MATAGRKSLIRVAGSPLSMTNEATTTDDNIVYQVSDPNKQVWAPTAPIAVETSSDGENWTEVTGGYKLDRLFGRVIFNAEQDSGVQVRVSGSYLPMATVAEAYQFTFTASRANLDRTRFQHINMERTPGLCDATGSVGLWHTSTKEFWEELNQGNQIVVEVQIDNRVTARAWARPTTDETAAAVDGVVEESFEWEGTRDQDGRMVSFG